MDALPLREILASLVKEFESASVAADVSREHWRQAYESNALLREFSPSRIRITEATVSLPLALVDVASPKQQAVYLTATQLFRLLPESLSPLQRQQVAEQVADHVVRTRRMSFASKALVRTVAAEVAKRLREALAEEGRIKAELATLEPALTQLRIEFLRKVNANPERQVRFAYRSEDLAQLDASRLVRFDMKLGID